MKTLISFFAIPGSYIAYFLLLYLGWSELPLSIINRFAKPKTKLVCIFSHTSLWDFYILTLYLLAYPQELAMVRFLVRADFFRYGRGRVLKLLGALPASTIDENIVGGVDKVVDTLNSYDKFVFLISPKGSILKKPWKSGFYYIADKTDAKLCCVGLDYIKKEPVMTTIRGSTKDFTSYEDTCASLQNDLKEIIPLFREREIVKLDGEFPVITPISTTRIVFYHLCSNILFVVLFLQKEMDITTIFYNVILLNIKLFCLMIFLLALDLTIKITI
jgi:hypothetical protein